MTGNMKIAAFLVLFIAELTLGDTLDSMLSRRDLCTSLCEKTPIGFPDNAYVKSCCQRGCRFFNLVDSRYGWEQDSLNGTRSACEASCTEAYTNSNDRYICNTGCNFMAKQRVSDLLSLFTVAVCMEESVDILSMSPDMPENDILTDPGLRKELFPRWWDSDGFKLPQTHVKTIPMDARTIDYTLFSDYSGEARQLGSTSKSESFREMDQTKDISILSFVFGRLYVIFIPMIMSATTLYLISKKDISDRKMPYKNINSSSDVALFIPDEAVMYKVPPPKYNESSSCAV
ncbi:uncharacterized protein LOC105831465 [Monomorium pharaonis]|uniref:uncharacterized protein LOC105831465 n=1 Tax=Monomorium pharaonis TaxID=307658 RepID=UPI00063F71F9|nr:uncharacterized protein LOC105831465 [Monomorium pharaonis]